MKVRVCLDFVSVQNSLDSSVDLWVGRTGLTGQDAEKHRDETLNEFESHARKLVGQRLIFFLCLYRYFTETVLLGLWLFSSTSLCYNIRHRHSCWYRPVILHYEVKWLLSVQNPCIGRVLTGYARVLRQRWSRCYHWQKWTVINKSIASHPGSAAELLEQRSVSSLTRYTCFLLHKKKNTWIDGGAVRRTRNVPLSESQGIYRGLV